MQALSLRPRATLTTSFPRIALRYFDGVNDAGCVWGVGDSLPPARPAAAGMEAAALRVLANS